MSGVYAGATGKDIATQEDLGLSYKQRGEIFGQGLVQVAATAIGAYKGIRAGIRKFRAWRRSRAALREDVAALRRMGAGSGGGDGLPGTMTRPEYRAYAQQQRIAAKGGLPQTPNEFATFTAGRYTGAGHQAARGAAWRGYARQQGIVSGIHRSIAQRTAFLKQLHPSGLAPRWMNQYLPKGRVPPGYHVDHIRALFDGGLDVPENMALKLISQHIIRHRWYRP